MKKGMSCIMFDRCTIEESIEAAGKIGYDGIELRTKPNHIPADTTNERLAEIRAMIGGSGLEVPCIACFTGNYIGKSETECEKEFNELKRFVEFALELKCPTLRHWAGAKPSSEASDDDWKKAALWAGKAADYAGKYGLTLAFELHHKTMIDTVESALSFLKYLERD